jgi:hypothetical protein
MEEKTPATILADNIALFETAPSMRFLQDKIDRLPISADAKSLLMDIAALTLTVGGKVLAFGRKILAVAFELANKFQNVIFGVLIALILSAVLATSPVLGAAIASLLTPLMMAFGIARGAIEDFRNMAVQREIDGLKDRMTILAGHV